MGLGSGDSGLFYALTRGLLLVCHEERKYAMDGPKAGFRIATRDFGERVRSCLCRAGTLVVTHFGTPS